MKAPLKTRDRPTPQEAVRIARTAAPASPPARLPAVDKAVPFNTRMRLGSIAAIEARARRDGISLNLVLCRALCDYGIEIAPADLEDGTPRRRVAA